MSTAPAPRLLKNGVDIAPVLKVTRHAFSRFPLLYVSIVLSIVSVFSELAAMASLFPLAELSAGRAISDQSVWITLVHFFSGHTPVLVFLVFFFSLLSLRVATASIVALLQANLYRRMIAHFSANAFETCVRDLSFRDIQDKSIGHFITLAGDEANRASQIVTALVKLFPIVLLALLYLGALLIQSKWVGMAVIFFLTLTLIGMTGAFRRSHDLGARQQEESRALNTFFIDALNGLRTVRAFNAEDYAASRYREMIKQYARTCFSVDAVNILGRAVPALLLLIGVIVATVFWMNETALSENLAFAMAAAILILRFLPLVGQALDTSMRLTADMKAGKHIADVVDTAEAAVLAKPRLPTASLGPVRRIEFRRVTFSYDANLPILNEFSAVFEAGNTYAVVGTSGAGKSTVVDLLLGFRTAVAGDIEVNGINVRDIHPRALRSRVTLVEQQARLLTDSVRNNLTFGRSVDARELDAAVRVAELDAVISALPAGYETLVSYQGANFSGGQRQRLNIARALVGSADVLVLDESTAGLDAETRDRVVANLKELFRSKILIFLTHDKDLISEVDQVIALEGQPNTDEQPVRNASTETGIGYRA